MSDPINNKSLPPRRPNLSERGRSHSRYSYGIEDYETVPELNDMQRYEVYRKMRKSDPTVSAAIRSIELPITQGTFDITPPSDPNDTEKRQSEYIASWLFDNLDWPQIVRSAITSFTYGFALFEKVYMYDSNSNKQYIIPRKLGFRPQRTIEREERSNKGEITHFIQQIDGEEIELPRRKCILITIDAESPDDWRGQSVLRSAYKPWYIKEKMELVTAIGHERFFGGIPVLKSPEGVDPEDITWIDAEQSIRDLHSGVQSYALLPFGWELTVLERLTQSESTTPFIRELKDDIKTAVLALHLRLGGNEASGSKALGVAFIDSFLHAVQSWANLICEAFNRDLIRELVNYNWQNKSMSGITKRRYPKLTVTNIYKTALTELAYLVQTGVIKPTPELVRYIFEQYGIRLDVIEASQVAADANNNANNTNNNTSNNDNDNNNSNNNNDNPGIDNNAMSGNSQGGDGT